MKKNPSRSKYPKVSIVLIAYNEADHISDVIEEYFYSIFYRLPRGSEFILYLDKPTDDTPKQARKIGKKHPLTLVEGKQNLGYAGAMKTALKMAKNDLIFYSDSSGKHTASDFWHMLPYANNFEIVTGHRKWRSDPYIRRFITFCQRLIVSILFSLPMHDFNTGFKIVHRQVVDGVVDDCKYTKQSFSTEFLIRASKKGYKIKDVPVVFRGRKIKETGTNFSQLPGIINHSLTGIYKIWQEVM